MTIICLIYAHYSSVCAQEAENSEDDQDGNDKCLDMRTGNVWSECEGDDCVLYEIVWKEMSFLKEKKKKAEQSEAYKKYKASEGPLKPT